MKKSKEEIIKRLKEIKHLRDNDPYSSVSGIHIEADSLLLDYIDDKEIECAYDGIRKYYS